MRLKCNPPLLQPMVLVLQQQAVQSHHLDGCWLELPRPANLWQKCIMLGSLPLWQIQQSLPQTLQLQQAAR